MEFAFAKVISLRILPIRRTSSYFKRRTITSAHADVVVKQPAIKKGNSTNEIYSNFTEYCTIRLPTKSKHQVHVRSVEVAVTSNLITKFKHTLSLEEDKTT